jgi:phosphoglucosamine mutase
LANTVGLSFGTDGVRGVAFEQLDETFCVALGRAVAEVFGNQVFDNQVFGGDVEQASSQVCFIGLDTRESGPALAAALSAGLVAGGLTPKSLGVVPTPVVAHGSRRDQCLGAMISASHNVWSDNGIKIFAPGGAKLGDVAQSQLQQRLDVHLAAGDAAEPVIVDDDETGVLSDYLDMVVAAVQGDSPTLPLADMNVVLDCAHGAASPVAGRLFRRLGATVEVLNADPNGRNINERCGSTHPEALQARVSETGADLGLAFDGDADRLIAVAEDGSLVDGDRIMGLMALDLRDRGLLTDNTLVVTVMSNLGLRRAMESEGIRLLETGVGDRYVLEALGEHGLSLGGEQSGHLIFADIATTGDGMLSGALLAERARRATDPMSVIAGAVMITYPQVLINVRVAERPTDVAAVLSEEIAAAEAALGDEGRVLVRASGTEPLVRVMVEAASADGAQTAAASLAKVVESRLG